MLKARVMGPIWATKRISDVPAGALLELETVPGGDVIVALDQLGSGPGDLVLVATGSSVSRYLTTACPIDALVVGVIDEPSSDERTPSASTK